MQVRYLASFEKSFDNLSQENRIKVDEAVDELLDFFMTRQRPSKGLGIKKLRKDFWEVRVGIKVRIFFELKDELITFILLWNTPQ